MEYDTIETEETPAALEKSVALLEFLGYEVTGGDYNDYAEEGEPVCHILLAATRDNCLSLAEKVYSDLASRGIRMSVLSEEDAVDGVVVAAAYSPFVNDGSGTAKVIVQNLEDKVIPSTSMEQH